MSLVDILQTLVSFLPFVFLFGSFACVVFFYFFFRNAREKFQKISRVFLWIFGGFRFGYAGLLTWTQYMVWNGNEGARVFLTQGIDPQTPAVGWLTRFLPFLAGEGGYFIFYSWTRFWLSAILAVLCAVAFFMFLKMLRKYRERFFESGEIELGAFSALLAGWPGFIVFLALSFLSVIIISIIRGIFIKEAYTTLGLPFLVSGAVLLLFGNAILIRTGLSVLRVNFMGI